MSCRCKGLGGRLSGEIWDQGDAVGAWLGSAMDVIVFPTAETVKRVGHACAMHEPACRMTMHLCAIVPAGACMLCFQAKQLAEQKPDSLLIFVSPKLCRTNVDSHQRVISMLVAEQRWCCPHTGQPAVAGGPGH